MNIDEITIVEGAINVFVNGIRCFVRNNGFARVTAGNQRNFLFHGMEVLTKINGLLRIANTFIP